MKLSVRDIVSVIDCRGVINNPDANISILLTDSRSLLYSKETLFFALITEHDDGHKYIADLYNKGVRNFAIIKGHCSLDIQSDANYIEVSDTLQALQSLGSYVRSLFNIPIVGITGSNGKTIIKEWLYQLLHDKYSIVRSPRSYNSQIGVPLSVWQLSEQAELGIFEAGISLRGEMDKLENIIKPNIGIVTTIGDAHQENFTSLEEKCMEKLSLFDNSQCVIYNEDNELIKRCVEKKGFVNKVFSWSTTNSNASLFISQIEKYDNHTIISYNEKTIQIPFTDKASIENAITSLAFLLYLCSDIKDISERFQKLEPVAMRLDVSSGINGNILINDTYNSDINSLSIALDFLQRRSVDKQLKKTLILSDILQSGIEPNVFYAKVAELISQKGIQQVIGIGKSLMSRSHLFNIEREFYATTEEFLASGSWRNIKNSIILIKGSREFRFERITEQLEEKAHQTVLDVNLDAIIHNLKYFRSLIKPDTKIICMVKAFGYGVGSYELAKTLQERGADYLAVALADEGAELRREGISMPIIVMNPEKHAFNTIFDYNLEPEIYNINMLEAFVRESERRGILKYPVHIKLDTGMNRLGFTYNDIENIADKLNNRTGVEVKSMFSHLAGSDSLLFDSFTKQQIDTFKRNADRLESLLNYKPLRHILNSAGIERFPEAQFDMVRLGIGLYGISAKDNEVLKPVASLKTRILQIRNVELGETVGYSRKGVIDKPSRIAILPIGYADGFDRRLGNGKGKVMLNGNVVSTIGNICMDISMLDVTNVEANEGDEVIIFGEDITITQLAEQLETIPYEILTSISPRVKRIYYKE
ncbi:alanine racemase [Dysgonomonadaceae bacterium PH5-43]|nr:alanine racemase [Dysgonomonadaceae bacterium PH5-43]